MTPEKRQEDNWLDSMTPQQRELWQGAVDSLIEGAESYLRIERLPEAKRRRRGAVSVRAVSLMTAAAALLAPAIVLIAHHI